MAPYHPVLTQWLLWAKTQVAALTWSGDLLRYCTVTGLLEEPRSLLPSPHFFTTPGGAKVLASPTHLFTTQWWLCSGTLQQAQDGHNTPLPISGRRGERGGRGEEERGGGGRGEEEGEGRRRRRERGGGRGGGGRGEERDNGLLVLSSMATFGCCVGQGGDVPPPCGVALGCHGLKGGPR